MDRARSKTVMLLGHGKKDSFDGRLHSRQSSGSVEKL